MIINKPLICCLFITIYAHTLLAGNISTNNSIFLGKSLVCTCGDSESCLRSKIGKSNINSVDENNRPQVPAHAKDYHLLKSKTQKNIVEKTAWLIAGFASFILLLAFHYGRKRKNHWHFSLSPTLMASILGGIGVLIMASGILAPEPPKEKEYQNIEKIKSPPPVCLGERPSQKPI